MRQRRDRRADRGTPGIPTPWTRKRLFILGNGSHHECAASWPECFRDGSADGPQRWPEGQALHHIDGSPLPMCNAADPRARSRRRHGDFICQTTWPCTGDADRYGPVSILLGSRQARRDCGVWRCVPILHHAATPRMFGLLCSTIMLCAGPAGTSSCSRWWSLRRGVIIHGNSDTDRAEPENYIIMISPSQTTYRNRFGS